MKLWKVVSYSIGTVVFGILIASAPGWGTMLQAQQSGTREDSRLQQELQVMKSILTTTLSFVGQAEQTIGSRRVRSVGPGKIDALYLRGQGAVFTIPIGGAAAIDASRYAAVERELARLESSDSPRSKAAALRLLRSATRQGVLDLRDIEEFAEAEALATIEIDHAESGATPAPRPLPRTTRKATPEETQKEIDRLKAELSEERKQAESNRRRLEAALVDVLSRYGDSLTQLQPDEHINLVVSSGSRFGGFILPEFEWGSTGIVTSSPAGETNSDLILTVKVSDVRDFRAGRIDLQAFQSRIEKY